MRKLISGKVLVSELHYVVRHRSSSRSSDDLDLVLKELTSTGLTVNQHAGRSTENVLNADATHVNSE